MNADVLDSTNPCVKAASRSGNGPTTTALTWADPGPMGAIQTQPMRAGIRPDRTADRRHAQDRRARSMNRALQAFVSGRNIEVDPRHQSGYFVAVRARKRHFE